MENGKIELIETMIYYENRLKSLHDMSTYEFSMFIYREKIIVIKKLGTIYQIVNNLF